MKAELQEKLFKKYPTLFELRKSEYNIRTLIPIVFGLEVGDGWYDLLDELFGKMVELDDSVKLTQVKEKFGALRVYIGGSVNEMFDLIDEYEEKSSHICDLCGKEGKLGGDGWLRTLCEDCINKEGE